MLIDTDQAPAPPRAFLGIPGLLSLGLTGLLVIAFPFSVQPTAAPRLMTLTPDTLSSARSPARNSKAGVLVSIDVSAFDLTALREDAFGDAARTRH